MTILQQKKKKLDLAVILHSNKWPYWTHSDNFKTQTKWTGSDEGNMLKQRDLKSINGK